MIDTKIHIINLCIFKIKQNRLTVVKETLNKRIKPNSFWYLASESIFGDSVNTEQSALLMLIFARTVYIFACYFESISCLVYNLF